MNFSSDISVDAGGTAFYMGLNPSLQLNSVLTKNGNSSS